MLEEGGLGHVTFGKVSTGDNAFHSNNTLDRPNAQKVKRNAGARNPKEKGNKNRAR